MTDIICPLCGKPNPDDLVECKYCQAPLKSGGFIAPPEGETGSDQPISSDKKGEEGIHPVPSSTPSDLEQAVPDWLKETEANFLNQSEVEPSKSEPEAPLHDEISEQIDSLINPPARESDMKGSNIDDDWLASLLAETGVEEPAQPSAEEKPAEENIVEEFPAETTLPAEEPSEAEEAPALPAEKPDWLTNLEATSNLKMEGIVPSEESEAITHTAGEPEEEAEQRPAEPPDWLKVSSPEEAQPSPEEAEPAIARAELPSWLEALRPKEEVAPTAPVEDVSNADLVTAGPLVGLRGVISPHPSAIRARKPPTYSVKLRVTDEQKARVAMMEELLAEEEKPAALPTKPIITTRNVFRLIVVVALILPIVWMIITASQKSTSPQSGSIPGVVDFTKQIQSLPSGAPVMVAFDYEAGFSGELNLAITNVISQLMTKDIYLALVSTNPSGPPLAESMVKNVYKSLVGKASSYPYYSDLGYIPGGTTGLMGLAISPKAILPYSFSGYDVWAAAPLKTVSTIKDFNAVIVLTNDTDTARNWIEQIGPHLREADRPLLIVSSAQAEPLILPYYEASPSQVQGLISGLAGGTAFAGTTGNIQQNGVWDAFSISMTVSVLVIIIGSVSGGAVKMLGTGQKKEN